VDQKIRRQIRDCEYFMPVISAATEARKEGYFRRRVAPRGRALAGHGGRRVVLLPITIDGTNEQGARVPDKFLTVQCCASRRPRHARAAPPRAPHSLGQPSRAHAPADGVQPPAGDRRNHGALWGAAPIAEPPPLHTPAPTEDPHVGSPPPMPPMPHVPEKGRLPATA